MLAAFIAAVRRAVAAGTDPADTAQRVAAVFRVKLASVRGLAESAARPHGQRLYIDPDGLFSIIRLRWQVGRITRIHDHVSWGTVGVVTGVERETRFDADLNQLDHRDYAAGETTWFTPPGDIHQVRNVAATTSVSVHVYGADLRVLNSSVRHYYPGGQSQ